MQSVARVTQLGYIGLGVSDMAAWRDFGGQVLGFHDNSPSSGEHIRFRIDNNSYRFWLSQTGRDDIEFVGWEVPDPEALKCIADRVRSVGIVVSEAADGEAAERMVMDLVRFSDPSGLTHEVYWGPRQDATPFCSPCGTSGFKAGDLGLGHIVLNVEDLDEALEFYRSTLGLRVRDFVTVDVEPIGASVTLVFTAVNPRHHSLAMINAPKVPGVSQKRLAHFMVEALTIDDVGNALQRFQSKRLYADQLGRHANDHMLSFYGTTPSGFQVEYGCGGRMIDNESDWVVQHYTAASFWGHGRAPLYDSQVK